MEIKKEKDIACAIMAGGRNIRMGRHKAMLEYGGVKFIKIIQDNMSKWFDSIFIVTNDKRLFSDSKIPVFEDIIPEKGPLGGIFTALSASKEKKVFCVACDMPFAYNSIVQDLVSASRKDDFDCFVPASSKGVEPLFAVYSKTMLEVIEKEIAAESLCISSVLEKCRAYHVDIREQEAPVNINTPEEYAYYADKIK